MTRVDCQDRQVRDLIEALRAEDVPRLTSLCILVPMSVEEVAGLDTLGDVAMSRTPAVLLEWYVHRVVAVVRRKVDRCQCRGEEYIAKRTMLSERNRHQYHFEGNDTKATFI